MIVTYMENPQVQPQMPVPTTGALTDKDKVLGAIAYLGPLFIVSFIMAGESQFVKFHAKQALVLFVAALIIRYGLGAILWSVVDVPAYGYRAMNTMMQGGSVLMLVNLAVLIVAIIAIVKAAQGEKWEIPGVAQIVKKINL